MKLKLTLAALIFLSATAALFLFFRSSENALKTSNEKPVVLSSRVVRGEAELPLSAMPEPIQLVSTDINDIVDPLTPNVAVIEKSTQEELDSAVEALSEAPPPSARALKAIKNAKAGPFIDAMPQALIDAEARPYQVMTEEQIQEGYRELEEQRKLIDG